jgi:hypothetical protein
MEFGSASGEAEAAFATSRDVVSQQGGLRILCARHPRAARRAFQQSFKFASSII